MRRSPLLVTTLALALAVGGAACGGDDSGDAGAGTTAPSTTAGAGETTTTESVAAALDGPLVEVTGQEVCDAVTADVVGGALGLTVTEAKVISNSTPQCSYAYTSDGGTPSNITVAAMSSGDIGGRDLADAFDYVVDLNEQNAGGTDVESVDVDAGDRAVRLSGEALHLGVVASGGHLFTVIVTPDAATGEQVDDLLVAIGEAAA